MAYNFNSNGGSAAGMTLAQYLPKDVLEMLHPVWHKYPPQSQMTYTLFAVIYSVMTFFACCGNLIVLRIFTKFDKLRTPSNLLVMNLAFCDFMIMATLLPECIWNFFNGGVWQFGDVACQIHSFCGSIFGYGQIATLVFITWDRYNVVVRGMSGTPLTFGKSLFFILVIWIFATFWATGPLIGYGSYALDGILASCSYGFMDPSFTNVAYICGCFMFAYVLPLLFISYCYFYIVQAVFAHEQVMREQAKKMNVASLKTNTDADKQSTEMKIAKVALLNVTLWVFAWTPFAVICLIGVLGNQNKVTPLVSALPIWFAKLSCVYNPLIYSLSHPRFRRYVKRAFPWFCITLEAGDNNSVVSNASSAVSKEIA